MFISLNTIEDEIEFVKSDSAQITIDYIAGIGIFLIAVFFVFQFMYGLFIPFQSGSDKVTLSADRAATVLVERMLIADKPGAMNAIDQGKLYYFNNTRLNYSNQTNYTNTLREIGLFSNQTVFDLNISVTNLTSTNNQSLVYMYNLYSNSTFAYSTSANTPMYQSGPALPDNTDVGQTKRLVLIVNSSTGYNETAIFSVRVW
ncbi:MAG: hypothetical protein Q8N79_05990 [Candidatus Methanoperedens sp.]|nr:hypothetical protein [Candidatus Methanoperedens sp.]